MLRLTRQLLRGIASVLTRYAHSIEKWLAQEDAPAKQALSDYSGEHPPAHWLAKVRQGAPQLLNNHSGDDPEMIAYSSEIQSAPGFNLQVFSDTHEEPPAHWIKKIRHGAPHLLDEHPVDPKNIADHVATQDQELPQPRRNPEINTVDSNREAIFVKQAYPAKTGSEADSTPDTELPSQISASTWPGTFDASRHKNHATGIPPEESRREASAPRIKEYDRKGKTENRYRSDASSRISGNKITLSRTKAKTESKQSDPAKPSARHLETESATSFSDRQFKIKRPRLSFTLPGISAQNTEYPQSPVHPVHEQSTSTRRTQRIQIKRYSYENSKTPQHVPDITPDPHDSVNKHAISSHDLNKTVALDPDKPTHFSFSHPSEEQLNTIRVTRQRTDQHLSETADNAAMATVFRSQQKQYAQYIAAIAQVVKPLEPDLPRWPNLPGEKESRLQDDRWPELPEEKWPEPDKTIQPILHFTQLQDAIKRKHHSELEQRGLFWNG